ncbi:MAG: helix-turn-helix transcriptional regulator [Marinilabiliaceae bacterium]|nr:helix-turn-helix transcriptional regulator [Marinilabiliaceae bacterium]
MTNNVNKSIGDEIRVVLLKRGISVTRFAEMIRCSRRHVYDIFNSSTLDIKTLKEISRVLDYDFIDVYLKDRD